jgi:hypothetical protein
MAYKHAARNVTGVIENPFLRVSNATVIAANSERPNESSIAEREDALMKRPPVLHKIAAAIMKRVGDILVVENMLAKALPKKTIFS